MLSVIVPTYNEVDNIEESLKRIDEVKSCLGESLEVLVVDGSSSDGTAEKAQGLLAKLNLGEVITLPKGVELACAILEGMKRSKGELVGVMDSDLSHPPELLPSLVEAVHSGYDIAIASRYVSGGRIINWGLKRRLLSKAGNMLARPLVGISDATSGYFVYRRDSLDIYGMRPRGFKILLELLVRGGKLNIREVPYSFKDRRRGHSKLGLKAMWGYLVQLGSLYTFRLRHILLGSYSCS